MVTVGSLVGMLQTRQFHLDTFGISGDEARSVSGVL